MGSKCDTETVVECNFLWSTLSLLGKVLSYSSVRTKCSFCTAEVLSVAIFCARQAAVIAKKPAIKKILFSYCARFYCSRCKITALLLQYRYNIYESNYLDYGLYK